MDLRNFDLMRRSVVTVPRTAHLADVFHKMVTFRVRHVLVVDEGRPWGMISDRELRSQGVGRIGHQILPERLLALADVAAADVAVRPVHTVPTDGGVCESARRMVDEDLDALVVVEHGAPVGLLTSTEFVGAFAGDLLRDLEVEARPTQWLADRYA